MSFEKVQQTIQSMIDFSDQDEETVKEETVNTVQTILTRRDKVLKILYKWQTHALAYNKKESLNEVQEVITFIKDLTG